MTEQSWLYTRGSHSVRVSREVDSDGRVHLWVRGPKKERSCFGFADIATCMRHLTGIEGLLTALGYRPEPRPERRGHDTFWLGHDRRRVKKSARALNPLQALPQEAKDPF
jgi:hypothetical protein